MGWARTLLLGDIGNRLDIADTERDLSDLDGRLRANESADRDRDERIAALEARSRELAIGLSECIKLFTRKGLLTPDEVRAFVDRIDPQ